MKADPICRWQNPFVENVKNLTDTLPKEIMVSSEARALTNENWGAYFFGTPYQLACQLGLYYEADNFYYPRFTSSISEDELKSYLRNWIIKYFVPNPYTKSFKRVESFKSLKPFSIHSKLCELLFKAKSPLVWPDIFDEIFPGPIGNIDILKNAINHHSDIIIIDSLNINIREGRTYNDLKQYIINIPEHDIDDKQFFFFFLNYNSPQIRLNSNATQVIQSLENLNENEIETVKDAIIKARIGQSEFRTKLLQSSRNSCAFTDINNPALLIAGHVKPWKDCDNFERLDINNGILLSPMFDKLFDKHLITFDENGNLIWSSKLGEETIGIIKQGIKNTDSVKIEYTEKNIDFFKHHRETFKTKESNGIN